MKRKARIARCYTDQSLAANTAVQLDKRSSHHLTTVLRARANQAIVLFNGDGNDYHGHIAETGKLATVSIEHSEPNSSESPVKITLLQAIARGDKMDQIIQKTTELGVNTIVPVYANHAIARLDESRAQRKREHWHQIAVSASEQSGRSRIPLIESPIQLEHALETFKDTDAGCQKWVLSPAASSTQLIDITSLSETVLLIGPESGFDPLEVELAGQYGFEPLLLGPRILRTETAGPAAIAILQTRFGDMGSPIS